MEWMLTAVWAWFGWNVIAPAMLLFIVLLIVGLRQIPRLIRQARCSHPRLVQAGVAGTEQHCAVCGILVCYTWDLPKLRERPHAETP